jgi:hypothetical protein
MGLGIAMIRQAIAGQLAGGMAMDLRRGATMRNCSEANRIVVFGFGYGYGCCTGHGMGHVQGSGRFYNYAGGNGYGAGYGIGYGSNSNTLYLTGRGDGFSALAQ